MKKLLFIFLVAGSSCNEEGSASLLSGECVSSGYWGEISGCYKVYDPVCGCNKVTYGNDCEAKVAGVVRWTQGECK